jgi:hypothetical protein
MDKNAILRRLYTSVTVDIPSAGAALANMARNPAYDAAANGTLGVPVIEVGGKKRVSSVAILRRLDLPEVPTAAMAEELGLFKLPSGPPAPEPNRHEACAAKPSSKRTSGVRRGGGHISKKGLKT